LFVCVCVCACVFVGGWGWGQREQGGCGAHIAWLCGLRWRSADSCLSRTDRSVSQGPRRAYEKERLDNELKLCGEYGLRAKKEIWRVNRQLAHCRKAARVLLTLDAKDPKRLFEGSALLKRLTTYGLLDDTKQKVRPRSLPPP